ncbi:hypothetical protein [Sphingomonas cavernae]|uniref:hypothetical protein n=1 Tax=Sphingomonas cavernae TaxID=2320861 RepID=UPI0015FEF88B|nr:hypothetical protein [Sphingomonas cavernae]
MTKPDRARTLADARALMAQALTLLDKAEALEAGAHLDAAIHRVDGMTPPNHVRLVHSR